LSRAALKPDEVVPQLLERAASVLDAGLDLRGALGETHFLGQRLTGRRLVTGLDRHGRLPGQFALPPFKLFVLVLQTPERRAVRSGALATLLERLGQLFDLRFQLLLGQFHLVKEPVDVRLRDPADSVKHRHGDSPSAAGRDTTNLARPRG
jgi:hypothetical protein